MIADYAYEQTPMGEVPRRLKDITNQFIDTKLYDAIKAGIATEPREVIRDWVKETYDMSDENYIITIDHIACTI